MGSQPRNKRGEKNMREKERERKKKYHKITDRGRRTKRTQLRKMQEAFMNKAPHLILHSILLVLSFGSKDICT